MDIVTAYLNSELKEEMYLISPKGFLETEKTKKIWKLKKAIYGLKQSRQTWNETINTKLKKYGMRQSNTNPYLYMKREEKKILIIAI